MSENGPKLFTNKPKKANLRPVTSATLSASSSAGTARPTPPPPPPPRKESFARRYKFVWPVILAVNFSIGAYLLTRTRKKDKSTDEEITDDPITSTATPTPVTTTTAERVTITENQASPPIVEPVPRPHIPEDLQRELYRWILEEKRKVKTVDREEKKLIDEEKAILKHFIKAETVPSL